MRSLLSLGCGCGTEHREIGTQPIKGKTRLLTMYPKKKENAVIITASVIAMILFWECIRQQIAIADKQFLKSMIPHHAGASLMSEQASIRDPEIKELCR